MPSGSKRPPFYRLLLPSVPLWPAGTCQSRAKRGVTLSRSDTVSSAVADDAATKETYVVYKTLYGEYRDFIRPLEMFLSEVDHEKYPDVRQRWRFEKETGGCCSWNPAISKQYLKP